MNTEFDQNRAHHLPEKSVVLGSAIPQELHAYPQWVCWKYVGRGPDKKPDKRPVNPRTLRNAGVHWSNTWTTFDHAYNVYLARAGQGVNGIGFVLTSDDPFVAIDLDNCVQGDDIEPEAAEAVQQLASYSEVSPSGAGLRILVACAGFGENVRRPQIEVYSHSRFVTLTGQRLPESPGQIMQVDSQQLQALLPAEQNHNSVVARPTTPGYEPSVAGNDRWALIFAKDRYGEAHRRRFLGDTSLDGGDHSLTVIRLLNCLARWTKGDAVQMRAMLLASPLANDKWTSQRGKGDWLDYQIADAIRYVNRAGK